MPQLHACAALPARIRVLKHSAVPLRACWRANIHLTTPDASVPPAGGLLPAAEELHSALQHRRGTPATPRLDPRIDPKKARVLANRQSEAPTKLTQGVRCLPWVVGRSSICAERTTRVSCSNVSSTLQWPCRSLLCSSQAGVSPSLCHTAPTATYRRPVPLPRTAQLLHHQPPPHTSRPA
jgi:hypothetical protein